MVGILTALMVLSSNSTNNRIICRAIQRDPALFKRLDDFDSSRYLNSPLSAAEYINVNDPYDRDHFLYGAGRYVLTEPEGIVAELC